VVYVIKRIGIMVLLLTLFFQQQSILAAKVSDTDILVELGVIKAAEKKIIKNVNAPIKKVDAYVQFIRLKGLDNQAKAFKGKASYKDIKLVSKTYVPYVNYSKAHPELGWDNKEANFNPNSPITYKHFISAMLNALSYKEGTDYVKGGQLEFAKEIMLISDTDVKNGAKNITIKDAHRISVSTLKTFAKNEKLYSQILIEKKVFLTKTVQKHSLHISNEENSLEEKVISIEVDN
jgi:hypothetical protein